MKILITGGAGYIGSILVPELLKQNHEIIVIDNFMYKQTSLLDCCFNSRLTVIRGDARNKDLLQKYIKDVDVIIPLACLVGAPVCHKNPDEARSINLDAVKMLVDLTNKDQIIISPTTNSGYGIGQEGKYCTEESPLNPISLYGKLKVELEKYLMDSGHAISLRLATVFGISPRMRLDLLVNDFTYRAVNDKFIVLFEAHFKRNYIHVKDVARAFIHAIDNFDTMKNEPYNVGLSDANLSKMELCMEIKKQVSDFCILESEINKDPDQRDYIVSNEKIEKTGFKPEFSLEKGISELIKGYQIIKLNQFSNI
ncbi:NAD-dependent epimerase/dehydratase family protein [Verrucomicrobiota bacterium]